MRLLALFLDFLKLRNFQNNNQEACNCRCLFRYEVILP